MHPEQPTPIVLPTHPLIDTDLQPLYQLTEPQYQSVINRLTNLLGDVSRQLHQDGNTKLAQDISERSHEILRDYDDDIAEAIRWVTRVRSEGQQSSVRQERLSASCHNRSWRV